MKNILEEGIASNEFELLDSMKTARILHFALKGLEVPYIRGVMTQNPKDSIDKETVANLIFKGILKK